MKQYLYILTAIALSSGAFSRAQAQQYGNGVVEVPQQQVAPSGTQAGGPIYIVNKYQGSQDTRQDSRQDAKVESRQGVQDQPVTVVESSPISESRADQMRKSRLSVESQTESKIVEKLEAARIEDEKARQDRVLGASFGSNDDRNKQVAPIIVEQPVAPPQQWREPQPPPQWQQQPPPPPIVQVQPIQVVPVQVDRDDRKDDQADRGELRAEVRPEDRDDENRNRYYISGDLGFTDYSGKANIQNKGAGGFSVGTELPDNLVVEGSFLYSTYNIQTFQEGTGFTVPPNVNMTQYNLTGALKYEFSHSRFRPYIGALAGYTYRHYTDADGGGNYAFGYDTSTNAFDVGATVGADFQITKRFSIGADFRYLTNVAATGGSGAYSQYGLFSGNPIEKIDYYALQAVAKFTF